MWSQVTELCETAWKKCIFLKATSVWVLTKHLLTAYKWYKMQLLVYAALSKQEHITPILISLHWSPILYRIDFQDLLLVFKSLNGLAPVYIYYLITVQEGLLGRPTRDC